MATGWVNTWDGVGQIPIFAIGMAVLSSIIDILATGLLIFVLLIIFLLRFGLSIFECCWTSSLNNVTFRLQYSELTVLECRRLLETYLFC